MAATANIRAVITAQDNASRVVTGFSNNVAKSGTKIVKTNNGISSSFSTLLTSTALAAGASRGLMGVISQSVGAANKYQNALLGLSSIAKAFGHDVNKAKEAAQDLAKDGLMTVADSARGLKNLLQSGFSLPQAIKLMNRFKDSAAFGKQGALEFGEAIVGATEGIKNGNSILVDNAGVTKNLSRILEEAGFSAQDLMRATTDTNVRMALFKGIVKETNANVGDAAKLTETYAGEQAKLTAKTTELKQQLGEALQPVLSKLLEKITPLVEKITAFIEKHPELASNILIVTTAITGLIGVFGALGLAIMGLSPIFTGFKLAGVGAIKAVGVSLKILKAAVANPLVLALTVAVSGFAYAMSQINKLKQALGQADESLARSIASEKDFYASLNKAVKEGRMSKSQAAARKTTYLKQNTGISGSISNTKQGSWMSGVKLMFGGMATGGPVSAGTPYMVGERRPEMFVPREAGRIVPQPKMGGSSPTYNLNVNVGVYAGTEMEKRKLAESLMKAWQDLQQSRGMA